MENIIIVNDRYNYGCYHFYENKKQYEYNDIYFNKFDMYLLSDI